MSIKFKHPISPENKKYSFGEEYAKKSKYWTFIKYTDLNKKSLNNSNKLKIRMAF